MPDGRVEFEITADGSKAFASIDQVTDALKKAGGQWEKSASESTDNISSSFASMAKKITAGFSAVQIGKMLLDLGKEAVNLASDLEEVQNVVDVTFGQAGSAKIEAWAKKAGTQFGLSETQAKKFTSTLGAMMKSAGMSGDEIVDMSTDLAGLAADMASFYNLDFETAFQKIRSGISGETEPLKQLGINMSVANLNAYALAQGLEKTFDQMDQAEQTMLRYQYMMQATSDAQGDFARTSDGFANASRALENNIESLKTKFGEVLLPKINEVVQAIKGLFPEEETKRTTVFDEINKADIDKETKLAEIHAIAGEAQALIDTLDKIPNNTSAGKTLGNLAEGANKLNLGSSVVWKSIMNSLKGIDGLNNLFGSNSTDTIDALASALGGDGINSGKADAWKTFMGALASNADAVSNLTGKSPEATANWLHQIAQAANELDENDAEGWQQLMASFFSGIDLNTEEGKSFAEELAKNFLAMGSESQEAVAGLTALGYSTDEIQQKQTAWLGICKELVSIIPGLSNIIDTQTGEIKGGIPAIREYADEWERVQEYQAELEALNKKKQTVEEKMNIPTLKGTVDFNQAILDAVFGMGGHTPKAKIGGSPSNFAYQDVANNLVDDMIATKRTFDDIVANPNQNKNIETYISKRFAGLSSKEQETFKNYVESVVALKEAEMYLPAVQENIAKQEQKLNDQYADTAKALEDQTAAAEAAAARMTELDKAASNDEEAMKAVKEAVENADSAMKALADHVQDVRNKTLSAVEGIIKGFDSVNKAGEDLRTKSNELAGQEADALTKYSEVWAKWGSDDAALKKMKEFVDNGGKLTDTEKEAYEALVKVRNAQKEVNEGLDKYKPESMMAGLQSQINYMDEYLSNLEKAKELGYSDALLASLSDGSAESAEYLAGLVGGGQSEEDIQKLNQLYSDVQKKKEEFTDGLTDQKLTVDELYNQLLENAKTAVAGLDLGQEAGKNGAKTVEGLAAGIAEKVPDVKDAVDSILAQLARLALFGITLDLPDVIPGGFFGSFSLTGTDTEAEADGKHESGLNYVPFDGYLASLHAGEGILTAEENRAWQNFKNTGNTGIDYDTMGGVMRDNIRPGGNVYLDGRVVGSVISDQQGRSYRQLQRSGWQG